MDYKSFGKRIADIFDEVTNIYAKQIGTEMAVSS